ncbi:MAG: 30S ribosomal protein S13 [Candidatus Pacearchaeota archaeon]
MAENTQQEIKNKIEREKQKIASLVRIYSTDISGDKNFYVGMTKIKGISFQLSNAISHVLKIDKNKKLKDLTKEEILKIEKEIKNPNVPYFLFNRVKDIESGLNKHLLTTELDLQRDFDIKRLKKIRSYRGLRHAKGLPVRGQRTKSHFRKRGKNRVIGVQKKK